MKTGLIFGLTILLLASQALPQCGSGRLNVKARHMGQIPESEWSEIDNILISDTEWKCGTDGIHVRVKTLSELEYGQPFMLKIYLRQTESDRSRIPYPNLINPGMAGIVIHLDKIEGKGSYQYSIYCQPDSLEKMKFWKDVLEKKNTAADSIDLQLDIWHPETFSNPASYRPGGWRGQPSPGPVVEARAIEEGSYLCWLEIMLPQRSKNIWSGILTSSQFYINVSPEYFVTEPVELRIPSELILSMGPSITYREDKMETITIYKRKGFKLHTAVITYREERTAFRRYYGKLPGFQRNDFMPVRPALYNDCQAIRISYRLVESSHGIGHMAQIGGYGVRTIWEKEYEIHFTEADIKLLSP